MTMAEPATEVAVVGYGERVRSALVGRPLALVAAESAGE